MPTPSPHSFLHSQGLIKWRQSSLTLLYVVSHNLLSATLFGLFNMDEQVKNTASLIYRMDKKLNLDLVLSWFCLLPNQQTISAEDACQIKRVMHQIDTNP